MLHNVRSILQIRYGYITSLVLMTSAKQTVLTVHFNAYSICFLLYLEQSALVYMCPAMGSYFLFLTVDRLKTNTMLL
jgi:hypothetical protein